MLKYATVVLCGLGLLACQKGEAPATARRTLPPRTIPSDVRNAKVNEVITPLPQFIDHAVIGAELDKSGMVAKDTDTIHAGNPVYVTMVFRESPPGLQASAVWLTAKGQTLRTERKEMNGSKVATFSWSDKVKPGRYKVKGYWGGNLAVDREFEIVKGK